MHSLNHPILTESFAVIDREMGAHCFSPDEYAVVRRVIHSTADFEFKHLLHFSPGAIDRATAALAAGAAIVTDVSMVKQGISTLVSKTFGNPIFCAVDRVASALPGKTRTEAGLLQCWQEHPEAVYAIGNAPTALLALCNCLSDAAIQPALVIGAPVGFISVRESKAALAQISVPQIRVDGRKGGSSVAAAIVNALLVLAWEQTAAKNV
jgi:precorrin-8X/cobalt-precorrin-8 methylmutase